MTKKGYQRNKYLDDLGISIKKYGTNFLNKKDDRWKFWKKERKMYGFDSRECWNLDTTFVEWIYSHFMKYKEDTIVDLTISKFEYQKEDDEQSMQVDQSEAIDIICNACKEYLLSDSFKRKFLSRGVMRLIGDVMPDMWW